MNRLNPRIMEKAGRWADLASVNLGILIVNACFSNAVTMDADAGAAERVLKTVPSTFEAPPIARDLGVPSHTLDTVLQSGIISSSIIAARATTKPLEAGGIILAAQAGSNVVDGLIVNAGLLDAAAKKEPDVGTSAGASALFIKATYDRIDRVEDPSKRRALQVGAAAASLSVAVAASYADRPGFYTDLGTHVFGGVVGLLANMVPKIKRRASSGRNPVIETFSSASSSLES